MEQRDALRAMKQVSYAVLICLVLLLGVCGEEKEPDEENNVFKATSDWQPLRKDQAIPRGLHVRLNLRTGEREAKLLDPEDDGDGEPRGLTLSEDPEIGDVPRSDAILDQFQTSGTDEDRVKKKFRSYSELKKELKDIKLNVKTEAQAVLQLLSDYKEMVAARTKQTVSRKEAEVEEELLGSMEDLVHQYDTGVLFVQSGGLSDVVFKSLNSTFWKVRYAATKLFSAAVQNNLEAKLDALDEGPIPVLLRTLSLDEVAKVKSGALTALSCLIRGLTEAQLTFLEKGGIPALVKQFNSDTSGQLDIQIKAVVLIQTLVAEWKLHMEEPEFWGLLTNLNRKNSEKMNLGRRLHDEGFCRALVAAILRPTTDPQVVSVFADGMLSIIDYCHRPFSEETASIRTLAQEYHTLPSTEEFEDTPKSLDRIVHSLTKEEFPKDEL